MWGKLAYRLSLILVILLVILDGIALINKVAADGFQWTVDCKWVSDAGQLNYWIGYISPADEPEGGLTYIGNGPDIEMTSPLAGTHQRQVRVLLPDDSSVVSLFEYPDDVAIRVDANTPAPYCNDPAETPDLFTITKYVEGGNHFTWEIFDGFTWSAITGVMTPAEFDENGNEFTRLDLGADNLNHNPDNYRVTAVD